MAGEDIDRHFPPQGPCAFCGQGDAHHRIIDAVAERHRAGDSVESLARDYDLPLEAVVAAIEFAASAVRAVEGEGENDVQ